MVICLERGADLHMAQLMPLTHIVSCFRKIQIGFTFLVPPHPPDKGPLNGCVCVVGDNWLTTSGVVAGKRGRATHALVNISEGQSVAATTDTTWVLPDNECVTLSLSFTIVS